MSGSGVASSGIGCERCKRPQRRYLVPSHLPDAGKRACMTCLRALVQGAAWEPPVAEAAPRGGSVFGRPRAPLGDITRAAAHNGVSGELIGHGPAAPIQHQVPAKRPGESNSPTGPAAPIQRHGPRAPATKHGQLVPTRDHANTAHAPAGAACHRRGADAARAPGGKRCRGFLCTPEIRKNGSRRISSVFYCTHVTCALDVPTKIVEQNTPI